MLGSVNYFSFELVFGGVEVWGSRELINKLGTALPVALIKCLPRVCGLLGASGLSSVFNALLSRRFVV